MTSLWCSQRSPCWCSVDPSPMGRHAAAHFLAEGETRVAPLPPRITGRPETTGTEETNQMPLERRSSTTLLFICRRYFALYNKLVQDYSSAFPMIPVFLSGRPQMWLFCSCIWPHLFHSIVSVCFIGMICRWQTTEYLSTMKAKARKCPIPDTPVLLRHYTHKSLETRGHN